MLRADGKVPVQGYEAPNKNALPFELENGYIRANENMETNIDGVFAAGDNRIKPLRQLVTATSDGAVAAINAEKYINRIWK